jgi:adenine-specific DNA glycosylase
MKTEKEIWQFAETILPEKRAYEWNQALMDFGATICTARQPHCRTCVLKQKCSSGSALLCNEGKAEKIISREKKYYGYPVRYYRGKIVEMLRTEKKYISPEWIAGQLFSKITNKKIHFVQQLADALEKDGLLRKKKIHTTRRYHLAVQ